MPKWNTVIDRVAGAGFLDDVNDPAIGGQPTLLTSGSPVAGQLGDVAYLSAAAAAQLSDPSGVAPLFGASPITSIAFGTPTVTVTGVFPNYSAGWIGKKVTVAGATTGSNNGTYVITGGSTTTIAFSNAAGGAVQAGAGGTIIGQNVPQASLFEGLYQYVQTSAGQLFTAPTGAQSITGTAPSMTINGFFPGYVAGWIGNNVVVAGAANAANNGTFAITGGSTTTLTFQNAIGVAEQLAVNATVSIPTVAGTQPVNGSLAFWSNWENYIVNANAPAAQTLGTFAGVYINNNISYPITLGNYQWIQIAGKAYILFSSVVTDTNAGDLVVVDQTPAATANTIADATTVTAKIAKSIIGVALGIPGPMTLTPVQITRSPLF